MREAADQAARIPPGEEAVRDTEREQPDRSRPPDERRRGRCEDDDEPGEGDDDEERLPPVGADLLLERHGANAPLTRTAGSSRRPVPIALVGGEEFARGESKRAGEEERRERLDRVVVREHRGVVVPARGRDLVLRVGQFRLQLEEVLRRLQVGVRLGDREETAERLTEDGVGGARPRPASKPLPSRPAPS